MACSRSYDDSERNREWIMMPGGDMTNHQPDSMSLTENDQLIEFRPMVDYESGEQVTKKE